MDEPRLLEAALWYAARGWCVLPLQGIREGQCTCQDWRDRNGKGPCSTPGKHPRFRNWSERATTDATEIEKWFRHDFQGSNIGIATGAASGIFVLDVDPKNGGEESLDSLIAKHGRLPDTLQAMTGSGGRHFYFAHPGGTVPNEVCILPGLDTRGDGGQVVAPPSLHMSGRRYDWDGLDGFNAPILPAPGWLLDLIAPKRRAGKEPKEIPQTIPDGTKHRTCVSLAGSMRRRGCNSAEILAALLQLAQRFETPVPSENLRAIAEDIENRYMPVELPEAAPDVEPQGSGPDLTAYLRNDHGNAERLIALYGHDIRYCHALRKWLVWDGRRWAIDEADQARRLAKLAMLEALAQAVRGGCGDSAERFARGSLDARRIASLLSMAECELPITPAKLDTNPHLLNFLNGTVDLQTGQLREHRREDFITKLVHFSYKSGAECPTFAAFLQRIMGGGPDASELQRGRATRLVLYLQKALGYSLTGTTLEKVVFMPHGAGNNGKTTLLSTFLQLLEEYAVLLQIDTLMVRQESNNTQADLADLRGARFVMTSETEEGQRLAEGKLKRITQGMGRIKATRKYENPIEFEESHKLWMDANHRPVVRGTDNAIWNRLHPIPFEVVIPDEEIDRELPGKLMAEGEGILAWAVLGAVQWFKEGLGRPPEVELARRVWRDDMDQVGRFIEECCKTGKDEEGRGRQLYAAYRQWAEGAGEHAVRESDFSQRLVERGFTKKHTEKGAVYSGIG